MPTATLSSQSMRIVYGLKSRHIVVHECHLCLYLPPCQRKFTINKAHACARTQTPPPHTPSFFLLLFFIKLLHCHKQKGTLLQKSYFALGNHHIAPIPPPLSDTVCPLTSAKWGPSQRPLCSDFPLVWLASITLWSEREKPFRTCYWLCFSFTFDLLLTAFQMIGWFVAALEFHNNS